MLALVTGASGFLGGRVVQVLCERGVRVRILARPASRLDHLRGLDVELVRGDLSDLVALAAAATDVTQVFHCAALVADWGRWADFVATNVTGTSNLCDVLLRTGRVERLVHVSSTDVYGYPVRPGDEDQPLRPCGLPYNETKVAAENVVWSAARSGLPVTVLRPASIYGPRATSTIGEVAHALESGRIVLLDRGQPTAGLVHVDDVVEIMLRAASSPHALGRAYNVRSPEAKSWRQFIAAIARSLRIPPPTVSIPGRVAYAAAALLERAGAIARLASRPLLTRHAVLLLIRDQGYDVDRVVRELGVAEFRPFADGLDEAMAWWRRRSLASAA